MKVLCNIGLLRNDDKPAVELCHEEDLSSFSRFTRGNVAEFVRFTAKTVAERTKPGMRQKVEETNYTFHAYARSEGVCGMIISDQEYPQMVAQQLLSKLVDEFVTKNPASTWRAQKADNKIAFPELKEYIVKWQNPAELDSIAKIQRELDETKVVLHKTIESVLERGEKLETLVDRSGDLSASSQAFFKSAKKQNSCCIIM